MSNIEEAIKQLNEPDKSIGEALIEFYDTMKGLETNSHRGGLQATKIVMTINDIKQIIDNQTSTLRKEIEDLTRAYNQCSESHRRSVDSHCIEKELLQKEIEDLKEQNEKFAIDPLIKGSDAVELPTDSESEKWFEENIGIVNNCSASSAIYKFRLWLRERK